MSLADEFLSAIAGTSFDYCGMKLPPGFLWEDGQAYSRTTYQRLFEAITLSVTGNITSGSPTITGLSLDLGTLSQSAVGLPISGPGIPAGAAIQSFTSNSMTMTANAAATTSGGTIVIAPWGVGDGSTTFNVPDSRGRVVAGRDNMGGTAVSRLTTAGSGVNGATLGGSGGAQTHTLDATQIPAHSHALPMGGAASGAGSGANIFQGPGPSTGTNTSTNTGGGSAHNNTQPTIIKNRIIKF